MLTIHNLKNWKVEARGSEVQEHLKPCSEFEASSGSQETENNSSSNKTSTVAIDSSP